MSFSHGTLPTTVASVSISGGTQRPTTPSQADLGGLFVAPTLSQGEEAPRPRMSMNSEAEQRLEKGIIDLFLTRPNPSQAAPAGAPALACSSATPTPLSADGESLSWYSILCKPWHPDVIEEVQAFTPDKMRRLDPEIFLTDIIPIEILAEHLNPSLFSLIPVDFITNDKMKQLISLMDERIKKQSGVVKRAPLTQSQISKLNAQNTSHQDISIRDEEIEDARDEIAYDVHYMKVYRSKMQLYESIDLKIWLLLTEKETRKEEKAKSEEERKEIQEKVREDRLLLQDVLFRTNLSKLSKRQLN